MLIYYQNSLLASVVSVFGCIAVIIGLSDAVSEKYLLIALGIGLLICGKVISNRKAFKKWWKQIQDAGLEVYIQDDIDTAKMVYSKNPKRMTLKKIAELNPAAAAAIREEEDYE